jgi:signal transduction histidine kinase
MGLLERGDTAGLSERLVATQGSARLALAEMRRLIGLLDEDDDAALTPQPGLAELDRLVAETRAAGAQVDCMTNGDPLALPPGLDLAAFRVAQEALTNVLRHARPPVAHLNVVYSPREVVVEVTDSGARSRWNGVDRYTGRGVTGMRERVALYGGDLEVGPRAAGGFLVRARFPVEGTRV